MKKIITGVFFVMIISIGYRNIMGRNKFYFSINVDIILAIMSIGSAMETNQRIK